MLIVDYLEIFPIVEGVINFTPSGNICKPFSCADNISKLIFLALKVPTPKLANRLCCIVETTMGNAKWLMKFDQDIFRYKAPIEWYFIPVLGVVGAFILPAKFGRHYCGQYCPTSFITDGINPVNRAGKILKSRHLRKVFLLLFAGIFLMTFSPWKMGLPESMTQTYWAAAFSKFWILWIICPFAVAFPLIFLLGFWKGGRTWCNYVCPWGAIGVALGKPQLKVTTKCTDCKVCIQVCPQPEVLEGAIGRKGGTIDKNCLTCLKCVDVCSPKAIEWLKP